MPVVMEVVLPRVTRAQYEQLRDRVDWVNRPPDGALIHVVWWEGAHCHCIEVWESRQHWERFEAERLGPAAADLGYSVEASPVLHDPHEVLIATTPGGT